MVATPLFTPEEIAAADRLTIAQGTPGYTLMGRAGAAVACEITRRFDPMLVWILCGPGNNGGDGYVVARLLHERGWHVETRHLAEPDALIGDAARAALDWHGCAASLHDAIVPDQPFLLVDALFGGGLNRAISSAVLKTLKPLLAAAQKVVAIDMPSGIDGASGAIMGGAFAADLSVTFAAPRPGHYLWPGRPLRGELVVADIGLDPAALEQIGSDCWLNEPGLWRACFPQRRDDDHKYRHGHALIAGGPGLHSGASRLAAETCQRMGAGLTTVAVPKEGAEIYAASLTTVMLRICEDRAAFDELLGDDRLNALLIGPGFGVGKKAQEVTLGFLETKRPCVIDADALTSFSKCRQHLLSSLHDQVVLTPHDGEFSRLFDDIHEAGRLQRARTAAQRSGAVVVSKGPDCVVAAPDGRATVMGAPAPRLATAGTGDVLAGAILALLARGMSGFEAASAAVWLQSDTARSAAHAFIAEDLPCMMADKARQFEFSDAARLP